MRWEKVKSYDYIVISGNNEEIYSTKKEVNKRVKELTSQGKTGYFAKWDLINDEILEGSQVNFKNWRYKEHEIQNS